MHVDTAPAMSRVNLKERNKIMTTTLFEYNDSESISIDYSIDTPGQPIYILVEQDEAEDVYQRMTLDELDLMITRLKEVREKFL
jgi:hypothetical protein